jgi:hypothetical protein
MQSLVFPESSASLLRADSIPSQSLANHVLGTTPRSRLQQRISTSYAQQSGPNAMYVLYEQRGRQGSHGPSCGSAMDCESPCNNSQSLLGLSSGRKAWAITSSSSSSLTSPPHSMSPSNYTLPHHVPTRVNPQTEMRTSLSSHHLVNTVNSNLLRGSSTSSVNNNNPLMGDQVVVLLDSEKSSSQLLQGIGLTSPIHSSAFTSRRTSSGSSGSGSAGGGHFSNT